jgi:hypothetical protein
VFQTKTDAKYFLTVIGDCLLKKNIKGINKIVEGF